MPPTGVSLVVLREIPFPSGIRVASSTLAQMRSSTVASFAVIGAGPHQPFFTACFPWILKISGCLSDRCFLWISRSLSTCPEAGERRPHGAFFVGPFARLGRWFETLRDAAACILDRRSCAYSVVIVQNNVEERAVDM